MNPPLSSRCSGRALMALAAFTGLLMIAGCSSSGLPTPNQSGFGNSSLTGTYVVSVSGLDVTSTTESNFALTGTITADGKGNITGGTVDINDPALGSTGVFLQ